MSVLPPGYKQARFRGGPLAGHFMLLPINQQKHIHRIRDRRQPEQRFIYNEVFKTDSGKSAIFQLAPRR